MHTGRPAYPLPRQGLVASSRGRPWHSSHFGRGGERPPSPRAWYGFEAGCACAPPAPPSWGRSSTSDPSGKGVERRFEAAEDPLADRVAVGLFGIAQQDRDEPRHGSPWPSRTGLLDGSDPAP